MYLYHGTPADFDVPTPVSYTHLDVYKRQVKDTATGRHSRPTIFQELKTNKRRIHND